MREMKLEVPTYNASYYSREVEREEMPDFGDPIWPVLIHESDGVRIALGTHDIKDTKKPDVQIERQPNGWVIFLHPLGGSDPCGYVYFLDDGRSILLKEHSYGPTPEIEVLDRGGRIPEIDGPLRIGQDVELDVNCTVNISSVFDNPKIIFDEGKLPAAPKCNSDPNKKTNRALNYEMTPRFEKWQAIGEITVFTRTPRKNGKLLVPHAYVAYLQLLTDKAEQARRQALIVAAPELFWALDLLCVHVSDRFSSSASIKRDCNKARKIVERIRRHHSSGKKICQNGVCPTANRPEKWHAMGQMIVSSLAYRQRGNFILPDEFVAFLQKLDDKAEQARRHVLVAAAPELFWALDHLSVLLVNPTDRSPNSKQEVEMAWKIFERVRTKLMRIQATGHAGPQRRSSRTD